MEKTKFGKVEMPDEAFTDDNTMVLVSLKLPVSLVKALKKMSLNEEYSGKYQPFARDILSSFVAGKLVAAEPTMKTHHHSNLRINQVGHHTSKRHVTMDDLNTALESVGFAIIEVGDSITNKNKSPLKARPAPTAKKKSAR